MIQLRKSFLIPGNGFFQVCLIGRKDITNPTKILDEMLRDVSVPVAILYSLLKILEL